MEYILNELVMGLPADDRLSNDFFVLKSGNVLAMADMFIRIL